MIYRRTLTREEADAVRKEAERLMAERSLFRDILADLEAKAVASIQSTTGVPDIATAQLRAVRIIEERVRNIARKGFMAQPVMYSREHPDDANRVERPVHAEEQDHGS